MSASYPAPITRIEGETLALSTTIASLGIPVNHHQMVVYNPTEDFRLHLNPALLDAVFFDNSNSSGSQYERASGTGRSLKEDLTDRLELGNGTGTALDSALAADFLYLCFSDIIGGIYIDMSASVNGTDNTMAVTYRKNDDTWTDITPTDNTDTGASLAQDGTVTWTAPTDWKRAVLVGPGSNAIVDNSATGEVTTADGFWLRLAWDNGLDADTEIDEIWSLNKDTNRGYFQAGTEYVFSVDRSVVGSFDAVTTANTDTLRITYFRTVQ